MARHNRRGRISPFQRQAQDLTLVRYGPELSALTGLLRQAQQDRRVGVRQARAGGEMLVSAIDQARPGVRATYSNAGLANRRAAKTLIGSDLATLQGPAANTFRGAAGVEQLAASNALQAQQAATINDLAERRVSAQQGAVAGEHAARTQYATTRGQIAQRVQDLAREEGAYSSSTMMQLLQADAKSRADARRQRAQLRVQIRGQRQQERDALISQGFNPNTGRPITGGKLDPNSPLNQQKVKAAAGKKYATQPQQAKAGDTIQQAFKEAHVLAHSGASRSEVEQMLLNGVDAIPARPKYRTISRNGRQIQVRVLNPDHTQAMTPAIPGVKPINENLYVQAGLDLAYRGHLSQRTQNLLHARGIRIHPLGVTTYAEYMKRLAQALAKGPHGRVTGLAPGANGQMRPT